MYAQLFYHDLLEFAKENDIVADPLIYLKSEKFKFEKLYNFFFFLRLISRNKTIRYLFTFFVDCS